MKCTPICSIHGMDGLSAFSLVESEGRSRAAQPCESAGLQKSDAVELLPSFSGSFDSSHCGIFGANFPKPLAGAVDSW